MLPSWLVYVNYEVYDQVMAFGWFWVFLTNPYTQIFNAANKK